jgi:type VI secretion system protein ImpL
MGFGLYQGDKLGAAARNAYERLLLDAFLPRIAAGIEEQLARHRNRNRELLYEALKTYIMLHDTRRFDALAAKAFITADWEASLPRSVTNEQREALVAHLDRLLAAGEVVPPIPPDGDLLAAVRAELAQTPLPQRVYDRLKRLGVGANLPEFTIAKAGGPAAPLVFTRASGQPLTQGVPGLYSYDGYHKTFGPAAEGAAKQLADEEEWVLGMRAEGAGLADSRRKGRLIEDVRRLYLEDYAQAWEAYIRDVRVLAGGDLVKSIEIARTLSAPDSPLVSLTSAIAREVTLSQPPEREKTLLDKGAERLEGTKKDLERLFGKGAGRAADPPGLSLEAQLVDSRFEQLRRMVRSPGPGQPAPIQSTVGLLNELYTALTAAREALGSGQTPPPSEVPNKLRAEAGRAPEPVRGLLLSLTTDSAREQQRVLRENLNQQLSGQVLGFCTKAIAGRYPFQRGSGLDVTQEDFGRLFAPGAMLDEFFQKNLAPHVDTSTQPWSFRRLGDLARGEPSGALSQFQRAAVIREVFFRSGGRVPGLRLEFKPVEMDATIMHFILDVDGQLVRYSHGPQVPATVTWPGPKGSQQVRLQLAPPTPGGLSGQVFEGPWALFRMLDGVRIEPTRQPEKFLVTFAVGGRKARFEVFTASVQNPFRLRELGEFQCPGRL